MSDRALASASSSFKGPFAHGVLSAKKAPEICADAYAAASSSVLPTAWAVLKKRCYLHTMYIYYM